MPPCHRLFKLARITSGNIDRRACRSLTCWVDLHCKWAGHSCVSTSSFIHRHFLPFVIHRSPRIVPQYCFCFWNIPAYPGYPCGPCSKYILQKAPGSISVSKRGKDKNGCSVANMARQGIWQIPHSGPLWLVWSSKGGYEVSCPRQDIRNKQWITILVVALVSLDCFFPVAKKNTFGFEGLHKKTSLISPANVQWWRRGLDGMKNDPGGPSPQIFDQLLSNWSRLCAARSATNAQAPMNFYAQPGVHANHSKKKSTISTNSPALSRQKKQRPKHPCKNTTQALLESPVPDKPRRWMYQMPCLGLKKSAMSTQAKDAKTLPLLRGQIQGSLWVEGRRPM